MIALKKMYGDELLRLALVLSLLKTDPSDYLQQEALLLSPGLHTANGSDWMTQHEPQTLLRQTFIHPKSLDHTLMDYERWLFEELNSLGRYHDSYNRVTRDTAERMSNLNGGSILHTYLVNNVATDTVAPTLHESVESRAPELQDGGLDERPDPHDGVSDDDNVAHEVKVGQEESEDESVSSPLPVPPVTLSPGALHNSTGDDLFADIQSRSFNVEDFLVTPSNMHIKKEPTGEAEASSYRDDPVVKKEREPELSFSDDAMDDFVPYFTHKSESFDFDDSVYHQNVADLQDYDETLETLKEFKSHLDHLDMKQQQEDLEQYLLENTPLDCDEVYDLAPILEEELVVTVKRERASTSFTSDASSSGVSEMDNWDVCSDEAVGATETVSCSSRIKSEPADRGDELTQEDMDLIEVLWKQDVDMGFCLDDPLTTPPPAGPSATKVDPATAEKDVKLDALKLSEEEDVAKVKASLLEPKQDDPWAGLSYTVDTETGEYVLQGDLPSELVSSEESRFDLLEQALQLVELESVVADASGPLPDAPALPEPAAEAVKTASEGEVASEAAAEAEEGDMLHPGMPRHAPHHPHHPLAYHHQSIMRQMSVEQRWQDLASMLTAPPPGDQQYHQQHPHYHHGVHNISAGGYVHAHAHNAHYAAAALPPPPPPVDKHDNYGAASSLDGGYKVESHPHDAIYYQPQSSGAASGAAAGGDMAANSDGLLQAILSDDDLQLMDMAMNEGMYTMRMLDGSVVPHAHAPHHPAHPSHPAHPAHPAHTSHMMMSHERESLSDSAVSSMGSERVPSLSDGEWCDGGSDSAQDFHSSKFRPYESGMCRGGGAGAGGAPGGGERAPPQKKHHMFGKRCFQESPPSSLEGVVPEPRQPLIKYEYPEQACAPYVHDRTPTIPSEYAARGTSASLATQHAQLAPLTQPAALHLHSLASPPHMMPGGGGASEMARYGYAGATPERVRHNHTYSAPHVTPDARPSVRDKRVRRLTDGSTSDSGSTVGSMTSRDEKRARALGIPLAVYDIINLPMDEFNERLSKHDLSEAQLSLIRDIRRRGKNKVAAQNCRKRKLDQITTLADEVRTVRDRKQRLQRDHQNLLAERQRVKDRFAALYRHVFQNLRDSEGRPVSSAQYSLQQAADGNVVLVPKMHSSDHMNRTSDEELDRKKHYEQ